MRLRHIEIFHAVYVSGSVSGAAKALNVSQPTVSKVLRHAESQLGFDLFHREKGRIFPTEKGELLFAQTLPVFEHINELRKYAAVLASTRVGQLRLAMTPAFSLQLVPCALARFAAAHKDVSIEVETLHALEISKAISNNLVDLGLVVDATGTPGLSVMNVGMTEFVCVAPKSFGLAAGEIELADLEALPLIELNAKSPLGQRLNHRLSEAWSDRPQNQITAETYHLAKRLASKSAGVAIVDGITAYSGSSEGLTIHKVRDLDPVRVDLIYRNHDPLVGYKTNFIDILREELEEYS
ncbi:MAG: LysR family transcriptional regulator [Maricaulaceae bacterium]